jgi:hypothetical protein
VSQPRPHHLFAPTIDVLPADVHVEIAGGLVDLYADDNHPTLHRWRLTTDAALKLYRQLGERISFLPIRLKDTDQ